MKIKLVAIDMDGTLLYNKHDISKRVKETINIVANKGVKVVISTGRIYASALYYSRLLGVDPAIISCNGALIKEHKNNDVIYKCSIDDKSIEEVMDILSFYKDVYYQIYSENTFYARVYNEHVEKYIHWNENQKYEDRIDIKVFQEPKDILIHDKDLFKIYLSEKSVSSKIFNNLMGELKKIKGIYCVSSLRESIDIINRKVNKGKALEFLSHYYGIDRDSIMAIGDNHNDIEMINYASIGVAMGNGEKELKDVADYITTSNNEDGVAIALEKYIINT